MLVDGTETTTPVTLSALEFDVLLEHLDLEQAPLVLKVPSPGRTHSERAELVASVWEALSIRGLGHPRRPDPELVRMLRLLVHCQYEVDGRMWFGRSVRVLAASDDEQAVLAVKDGDSLTLRPAAPTGLPREALTVLPQRPPGPGRSVSIRGADLDAAAEEVGDQVENFPAALRRRGIRPDDAETLHAMVGDANSSGQFGAAARDRSKRRRRAGHVVGFFDTSRGRYVQLRRESSADDPWSTIAPVDERRMIGHIEELLDEASDG